VSLDETRQRRRAREDALFRWRRALIGAGTPPSSLPMDKDLFALADAPSSKRRDLMSLRLEATAQAHLKEIAALLADVDEHLKQTRPAGPVQPLRRPRGEDPSTTIPATAPTSPAPSRPASPAGDPMAQPEKRLSALLGWREARINRGAPESSLPGVDDLRRMAAVRPDDLADKIGRRRVPLTSRETAQTHLAEILQVLGVATAGTSTETPPEPVERTPTPTPASARTRPTTPPRPARTQGPGDDVGSMTFPPHEGAAAGPEPTGTVRADVETSGDLVYRWNAAPGGGATIYRVVTHDGYSPGSPDLGVQHRVTTGLVAEDARPVAGPVRFVEVWSHTGKDVAAAQAAPARLHARCSVVAPVRDAHLVESRNHVRGTWLPVAPAARVVVHRVPVDEASNEGFALEHEIDGVHGDGFIDESVTGGAEYEYRIYAVADVDRKQQYSSPMRFRVAVPGTLHPVEDFAVAPSANDPDAVDLSWSPPSSGRVEVYATAHEPPAASAGAEVDVTAIETAGLPRNARVASPVVARDDGKVGYPGVRLAVTTERVYLTPVTVGIRTAVVGRPVTHLRLGRVGSARLVERVSWQLLSFGWPAGADVVRAYITPRGVPAPVEHGSEVAEMDPDTYRRDGGIRLRGGLLPSRGCDVHLVPVAFTGGRQQSGPATTITYRGLVQIRYDLLPVQTGLMGKLRGGSARRLLRMASDVDLPKPVTVVLVHNPSRLPLSPADGTAAFTAEEMFQQQVPVTHEITRPPGGYVRAFVDTRRLPADAPRFAVLDPVVTQLLEAP
jgi:hypothetical protein